MNEIDWWTLTLIPGLAALGWSFRNALRIARLERERHGLDDHGYPEDPVGLRDATPLPLWDERRFPC